ncbi:MAG: plasmid mobilization relaxosome protein MobC [Cyclobacteriaceae bacterium]|nr:plasmid mobilization relaxosome protein MobC [Cyclobacteriaceae bacterium]
MARPPVNSSEKRIHQVNIRLTDDENEKASQYSTASGLSPANWIRQKVFTGKFPAVKLSPIDAALYMELKKIGVNLNQVTHRINQGDFPKEYLSHLLALTSLIDKILKLMTDDRQPDQG